MSSVVDRLNSSGTELPLSANQGRILNEKIAEISNPVSAEKDGLMSKEDKEAFDNMKDGGAIEYKEISGQTVDADDLIVPKLTVRYLNKNASTAENISNIPAKGGFVLESMCVRYVDEDNCGYIQTYYSQNSDSRILPFPSQDNIQTGSGLSGGVPWEDTCASMKPTKKWELLF